METTVARAPWDILALDIMTPMHKSENGYRAVLVVVDTASRWLELLPLRSDDPLETAFVVEQSVFLTFGPSSSVLLPSERAEFENPFPKILKKYNVRPGSLDDADPQVRTLVSRCLKEAKRDLVQMKREYPTVPWDHLLKHVSYKHRTRRHVSMPSTPQKLVLPFTPVENTDATVDEVMADDDGVEAPGSLSIRAQRDHGLALEHERQWFQSKLERFGGLSLTLKAEAMRSKMLLDHSASATFDGKSFTSPSKAKAARKKTKHSWRSASLGGRPVM